MSSFFSVTADIVFYLISCDYFHTFRFLLIVSSSFSSAAAAVGAINVANQNIISVLLHDYVTLRFTLRTLTKFHPTDTGRQTDRRTDVLTDRQTYINKYLYRKIYIYESVCLSVFQNEVGQTQGMTLYHLNQTLTQLHTMYILWLPQYESYPSHRLFTKTIFMSKRFGYY